jgi:hypothetical protein
MNYLQWCSVTINSGTACTNGTCTATVTASSTATVVATALPGFAFGPDPWYLGDGGPSNGTNDTGDGGPGSTSTVSVPIGATSACVSVCCETLGSPDCPASDPCN